MGLLEEAEEQQQLPGPDCQVQELLDALEPEEAAEVRALIWDPAWRHIKLVTIARLLEKRGSRVRADTLGRHRRGECVRCNKANS